MTRPEEAPAVARKAAERKRSEGAYGERASVAQNTIVTPERPTLEQLREWSLIEVDPELAYSTRRLGAPITALKRGVLRLLRQYTIELEAQQARFNMAALAYLHELDERVAALEGEAAPEERSRG